MTKIRASLGRLIFALFVIASPILLSDCLDAGGPSFITLGVSAEPAPVMLGGFGGSSSPPPQRLADVCVRLPVLLGSSVDKKTSVEGGLAVSIHASRDGASVSFPGADDGESARSYELSELKAGFSETVAVSADGEIFEATIETGCTNP
jgi:hypothetical protein